MVDGLFLLLLLWDFEKYKVTGPETNPGARFND